jgi:hypothetical protein
MIGITELQCELLRRAAGEPITDAVAVDASVCSALIKRRLVILLPAEGNGGRLIITRAGLGALSAVEAKKAAKAAGRTSRGKAGRNEKRAAPPPERRRPTSRAPRAADPVLLSSAGVDLPKGKLGTLTALLRRPDGASVGDMMAATGWQAHSVRGAMSGALKKKLGFEIASQQTLGGRVYRIVNDRQ